MGGNFDREDRSSGPLFFFPAIWPFPVAEAFALDLEPPLVPGDVLLRFPEADASRGTPGVFAFPGSSGGGWGKELAVFLAAEEAADDVEVEQQPPANLLVPPDGDDDGGTAVFRIWSGEFDGMQEDAVKDIFELSYSQTVVSLVNLGDNVMKPSGDEILGKWFVQFVTRGGKRYAVLFGYFGPFQYDGCEVF